MLVTKEIEIDMGHRIPSHKSKCRNPHGHRYKIEVGVDDKVIAEKGVSDEGMVIDFGDLKQVMMEILDDGYDHGFVIYEGDERLIESFYGIKNFVTNTSFQNVINSKGYYSSWEEYIGEKPIDLFKLIVVPFIPTAENLAKHWYELIKPKLTEKKIAIAHVRVWETPTSTAVYTKEDKENVKNI